MQKTHKQNIQEKDDELEKFKNEIELNKSVINVLKSELFKIENEKNHYATAGFNEFVKRPTTVILEEDEESIYAECIIDPNISIKNSLDEFQTKKSSDDLNFFIDELKAELEAERENSLLYLTEMENLRLQLNAIGDKEHGNLERLKRFFNVRLKPFLSTVEDLFETIVKALNIKNIESFNFINSLKMKEFTDLESMLIDETILRFQDSIDILKKHISWKAHNLDESADLMTRILSINMNRFLNFISISTNFNFKKEYLFFIFEDSQYSDESLKIEMPEGTDNYIFCFETTELQNQVI